MNSPSSFGKTKIKFKNIFCFTSYDATHGFSDQYIVELEIFRKAAKRAGLISDEKYFHKFPDTGFASVSIQLLRADQ